MYNVAKTHTVHSLLMTGQKKQDRRQTHYYYYFFFFLKDSATSQASPAKGDEKTTDDSRVRNFTRTNKKKFKKISMNETSAQQPRNTFCFELVPKATLMY